ncbi:hypothetical protein [Acetobacterium wieringae]|uniref:Uncharacterized protein n=1 Tax=Acetobacterium wieringae TaxID=52694 RepID=A0A1F2PH01_9FIRM|nr:hypothetical protein [Acetobacterium wieringae]OFV70162.1 hypothetical protein ACWI_23670 [Acetobacterium wieringae]
MRPIKDYEFASADPEPIGFSRGFVLTVVLILLVVMLIIAGLVTIFRQTTNAANAKLVYLAARARAIEFQAGGHYRVPVQADLIDLIGAEISQEAKIQVVDENRDATIDYIIYSRNGWATRYSPGETSAVKLNE